MNDSHKKLFQQHIFKTAGEMASEIAAPKTLREIASEIAAPETLREMATKNIATELASIERLQNNFGDECYDHLRDNMNAALVQ